MKVLYCNPIFLDYRLPFYKRLNELFEDEFYVMYSPLRYKTRFDALLERIPKVLGNHAIEYNGEKLFDVRTKSFKKYTIGGSHIPVQTGFLKAIGKVKPDVLITEGFFQWTPLVQMYGILHNIPVYIGYERTPWTERNNSKVKTLIRKIQDKFITGYLVNGSETKKYLMSIGVKEEKIHVGGMSADSEGLRKGIASMSEEDKSTFRAKFIRDKGLVYLFCGRVENLKGAPHLLEAWEEHIKIHPDDHIILVGYGDKSEEMEAKYKDVASVHLEGRVPYTEVHKYYAVADVFILPTLTDNWSLVIPEAMACGLPVATSIYNGCHPELVHEGENGYVFDTLDKDSMIKTLDYFHHVDLKAFGQRSIELEKGFNTENSAKREYEGIMKSLHSGGANNIIYLFTGYLTERKGIIPLLKAWKEHIIMHPHDSLVIVGNGDLYVKCFSSYGDMPSVYFEGRVPYEEVHKYYAIADVFLLPTIEDNWSLVIPEAMACGLPVATSIYNGCHPELVHEGVNGYVFDTFKKETIVKALDYFHHVDLKAFGQRSIELEKEYNTEKSAKREYESIINSL